LADLPLPGAGDPPVLAFVPYRQVRELGFAHHDDGAPLRCLRARRYLRAEVGQALTALPGDDVPLTGAAFDVDDDAYADTVKRVIEEEIGRGEGANFVIRRELTAQQPLPPARAALAVAGRLLTGEPGAYWVFAAHLPAPPGGVGDCGRADSGRALTMVGATPERHVSSRDGTVVMNPISGTFRYPPGGPTRDGLLGFLRDTKEVEELFMVVDEELKMMSRLCDQGGRVLGPYLKPMGRLAHTEYLLTGSSDADPRLVLRETMFAATVTGSPLENACRVIARHERGGRGHYSGMAALITGGGARSGPVLDAPILIRTAYLGSDGTVRIPVGATLVRHSVPEHEVAETHAKVAGLLSAFPARTAGSLSRNGFRSGDGPGEELPEAAEPGPGEDPEVLVALADRNARLAPFWLQEQAERPEPRLVGRHALVVDAEDGWTAMLAHVLRRLGMSARVTSWDEVTEQAVAAADLLVAGPGPGDPREVGDPRIAALRSLITLRRMAGAPLLAVCLSHQILAGVLGLPVGPLPRPYQGTQRRVRAFGREVRVGFYNTFTARSRRPDLLALQGVEAFTDGPDGEVVALRGPGFASVQFHLESILSPDGVELLRDLAADLVTEPGRR
ncbi:MAG TPA: anthranilate synthase family protein, partial [Kineosporiaceae bacterium]|nr:anthranilate synthase family protein [Kineosporiaceae bacterium]